MMERLPDGDAGLFDPILLIEACDGNVDDLEVRRRCRGGRGHVLLAWGCGEMMTNVFEYEVGFRLSRNSVCHQRYLALGGRLGNVDDQVIDLEVFDEEGVDVINDDRSEQGHCDG